jgi:hypothetical protein
MKCKQPENATSNQRQTLPSTNPSTNRQQQPPNPETNNLQLKLLKASTLKTNEAGC